jgi:hypothetical protein
MTFVILKLFISIAILYGLYLLYQRKTKAKPPWQFSNRVTKQQPSRHLQAKLVRQLNGDVQAANRLIALAKTKNPDKSMDWCVEKVIFDLQRDRGRY